MDVEHSLKRYQVTLQALFFLLLYNWIVRPETAKSLDCITVYLKNKYDYDRKKNKVTANAFLPKEYKGRLETSVFNIEGLSDNQVWTLGQLWTVVNPLWKRSGKNSIKGRGDLPAKAVEDISTLNLSIDPSPHPRHNIILGWSSAQEDQELSALELVVKTVLRPNPKHRSSSCRFRKVVVRY